MYGITVGSGSGSGYWGVQCFEDLETGWRKRAYFARLFAEAHAETSCFYEVLGSGDPTCAKQRILRGFLHGCMQKHRVFTRFFKPRGLKMDPLEALGTHLEAIGTQGRFLCPRGLETS